MDSRNEEDAMFAIDNSGYVTDRRLQVGVSSNFVCAWEGGVEATGCVRVRIE